MNKKLFSHKSIRFSKLYSVLESTIPFEERPSGKSADGIIESANEDTDMAHKLFSIFTADIIKNEIFFIR